MTPGWVESRGQPVPIAAPGWHGWNSPAPSPITPLIGRRREFDDACSMLRGGATRLVTLTGPGGIGKTRLAVQIAADVEPDFGDGVVWVPLAPIRDADAVVAAIATSVGVVGASSTDRLARALRGARLLLVLDNFEQVVCAAPQVAELLAACPMLHAVVTSRALLRIRGEHVLSVPPLSLRGGGGDGETGGGMRSPSPPPPLPPPSEAVTLFIERAKALVPDIALSETNASIVAEICRRLEGIPLAIELAAARVSHLSLPSLLDHMDRRLPLLVGGAGDLPARLQTMRNAIAWSHDLLTPEEQRLFCCLAVFDGGFTLEAISAVAAELGAPVSSGPQPTPYLLKAPSARSTLDLVGSLVEKSLVRHEPAAAGGARYAMLDTIREFAAELLAASGATAAVRRAHAAFFSAQADRDGLADVLPDGDHRLDGLEAERANMRAALTWWEESGQTERCLGLAAALGGFWFAGTHLREGQAWLERSLAKSDGSPSVARARALVWLGSILLLRGDAAPAETRLAEGLALSRSFGDAFHEAQALLALGVNAVYGGDPGRGAALLTEGIPAAEAVPDPRLASILVGRISANLGIAARERGDLTEAMRFLEEALRRFRAVAYRAGESRLSADLAYLSVLRGDYAEALQRYQALLARERGDRAARDTHAKIFGAALAAAALGWREPSTRWLGAVEALGERLGYDSLMATFAWAAWARAVEAAREALGEEAFAVAWAAGRALWPEHAIAEILTIPATPPSAKGRGTLSAREMDVLRLLVAGQSDRAIGAALFISHRTVEFHVSRIIAKLGVASRATAVAVALSTGLVDPPPASLAEG